jgi:hypothetical protein
MQPQLSPEGVPAPSHGSAFRALLAIFYSPAEAFSYLGTKRPWLVPVVACALLALIMNVMLVSVVGMGTLTRNQLEANPSLAERLGPERINEMVRDAESSAARKYMTYGGALIGTPVFLLLISGLTLGGLLIAGGQTRFGAVLAACSLATYAMMAVGVVGAAVVLAAVNDYSGLDPQNMIMLNASIFFDRQTSPAWVRSLASGIDLIGFWAIFLQSTGLHKLSERVSMKQALAVSIALYLVWVLAKTGWYAMFS